MVYGMNKIKQLALLALVVLFAASAHAQNLKLTVTLHSVAMKFTVSPTAGTTTNIYRAPCPSVVGTTCPTPGTFAVIGNAAAGVTTYTDSTVQPGAGYAYQITALCGSGCPSGIGGESVPSAAVGALIPTDKPQPPGGLTITTITQNNSGSNTTISAFWQDTKTNANFYALFGNNRILLWGANAFKMSWTGPIPNNPWVSVCDAVGNCATATP